MVKFVCGVYDSLGYARWYHRPRQTSCYNRDFTIGRREGSENVASKMNLRSFGLYRDYFNSLTSSNEANPHGVEFLRTIFKFRIKENKISSWPVYTSSRKSKIRQFHVVVVPERQ